MEVRASTTRGAGRFGPALREVVEPEGKRRVLVHPQRMKAIASAKLKNDRVDSETLAHLLRCVWGQFTQNLLR